MVYKYVRKTQQQSWDAAAMQRAIEAVKNDGMAYSTAAKIFSVPRNTLKRRVLDKNVDAKSNKKVLGKYRPVFTEEQEAELVRHVLDLEVRFFGVTILDLRSLAYNLAVQNGIPNNFNREKKLAGLDWVAGFRDRHPEISLRKPEQTSAARAQAFNKHNVTRFFNILKDVQEKQFHPAHRVFNVDETGLMTVQSKSSKILALKGRRQVGTLTSAERGQLSTFVVCMSAGGYFIPPFVIFPRLRMKAELQDGAPPGTMVVCHPSGWMQSEIFLQWFEHFLTHAKPSASDPVLLILDGHSTHAKNLAFIEKARESHTTVVCLPPHCTHKMQPLDVSFMGPFNTFYVQAIEKFLKNNPGRVVTQFQVGRLLGEAFLKAATPATAINGFRKCGIVPLNQDVFTEADYVAAECTDVLPQQFRPVQQERETCQTEDPVLESPQEGICLPFEDQEVQSEPGEEILLQPRPTSKPQQGPPSSSKPGPSSSPQPEPSSSPQPGPSSSSQPGPSSSSLIGPSFAVSPKDIIPLPKTKAVKKTNRKKGTAAVLTSSPYKLELEQAKKEKEEKEREKEMRRTLKAQKKREKEEKGKVSSKRKSTVAVSSKSEQGNKKRKCGVKVKRQLQFEENSDSDVSDADCLYCSELYSCSKDCEGWVRCSECHRWAHEACAGCEEEDDGFLCEHCH
ncbi:uncharacterized protein LOC124358492 [Homalodisca vitripennis]|nr:uncharacterized protein LOC124354340 [Homalodisca vitripennis]XP_046666742.1 uncharacterized protein LOC124358492 [Homalodisca vitripennis]